MRRVSCRVFTTFARALMISSLELNLAYISERRSPRLPLKSLKVLLWNSVYVIRYISCIFFGRRVSEWYSLSRKRDSFILPIFYFSLAILAYFYLVMASLSSTLWYLYYLPFLWYLFALIRIEHSYFWIIR